jgi:hypothetical protein
MPDPVRRIEIDDRIEAYSNYLPSDWMEAVSERAKPAPVLEDILTDMLLAWRATAYTASMPALMPQSSQAVLQGYMGTTSPDSSIITFAEGVLAKLSRKVPELVENSRLRATLMAELASIASEFRDVRANVKHEVPVNTFWQPFLHEPAFQMGVWSSQRVCYDTFCNAYENFITHCVWQLVGGDQPRTQGKEFKRALQTQFGTDLYTACWSNPDVERVRFIRNALSHANGRETPNLKAHGHRVRVLDGVLQIFPEDLRAMLHTLRGAVDAMVSAAVGLSEFAAGVAKVS